MQSSNEGSMKALQKALYEDGNDKLEAYTDDVIKFVEKYGLAGISIYSHPKDLLKKLGEK